MSTPPNPVIFAPIFKPKPWGGRRLATLLNKHLPGNDPVGESWELSDLPGHESRVRDGPLAGRTPAELVQLWGRDLLGDAELVGGRFPLLIKFLDACENLSVQVHPKPGVGDPRDIKHEAWYVVDREPGAKLYVGLKPGVKADDVARAANTRGIVNLLHAWNAEPGQCYYLPSGTPHALGSGVVVAEVQTPSDVTYRLYDWERVGLDGQPRELHIEDALANLRCDVAEDVIQQPWFVMKAGDASAASVARCEQFDLALWRPSATWHGPLRPGSLRALIVISGAGQLRRDGVGYPFSAGDVVLVPARGGQLNVELQSNCEWLEASVPGRQARN